MQYFKKFESFRKREIIFALKNRPNVKIIVELDEMYRIKSIENNHHLRFPFQIGERLNKSYEIWACNNNYTVNGEDTCPEEKIFGIRKSDIPKGHELRRLFPGKFRK